MYALYNASNSIWFIDIIGKPGKMSSWWLYKSRIIIYALICHRLPFPVQNQNRHIINVYKCIQIDGQILKFINSYFGLLKSAIFSPTDNFSLT